MSRYYFIGIGGIGMSSLARILLESGESVSGSDAVDSQRLKELRSLGATCFIGHQANRIARGDTVVYSSGISKDNEEYQRAKELQCRLWHRAELLAYLLRGSAPLLVTGTHGKTTTAALLAHTLFDAGCEPSFSVGGILQNYNTNGHKDKGLYFVAEADESDGSFLRYPSFGAIITNIEEDHMDYWQTKEHLIAGFMQFVAHVGSKKHLLFCIDDPILEHLHTIGVVEGMSYGFSSRALCHIESWQQKTWRASFDLRIKGITYQDIDIPLIGAHNVLNAAAVFALCLGLDIREDRIRNGFSSFRGVSRRVEKQGMSQNIEVYDDYAHHPTEIFATLRALKASNQGRRLVVAFQPHRYSRTHYCLDGFAEAFRYADHLVLTDIYAAGEHNTQDVSSEKILNKMKGAGFDRVDLVSRNQLEQFLLSFLKPGDLLITMGAGDITTVGKLILQELKET